MKRSHVFFALACCLGVVVGQGLTGCSNQAPAMTTMDKASFKGGPMPASAAKIMQQKMQQASVQQPAPAAAAH